MKLIFVNQAAKDFTDFPKHDHPYWEIILTTKGTGDQWIDGQKYPFFPGKIVIIPPHTPHSTQSPEGFRDTCIFFEDFTPTDRRRIGEFCDDSEGNFARLAGLAHDILHKKGPNAQAIANAIGDTMYQFLISWNMNVPNNISFIESFQNLLVHNISNTEFDIAAAIDATGFCRGYFRQIFKAAAGCSPVYYFNRLRIDYAKRQLEQYHQVFTIKEIGAFSGFKDPYHFSKVFKKYENISPSQYIEIIKKSRIKKMEIPSHMKYPSENFRSKDQ